MSNSNIFWVLQDIALPFSPRPDAVPEHLGKLIDCGGAQSLVWSLQWQKLRAEDRACLESGEYLPALAFSWQLRAAALMRACVQTKQAAGLLEVHTRRLHLLHLDVLMQAMASDAWLADAQVALVWGFAHDALMRPEKIRWPLPCRGAAYSCQDGLNVGWWALPEDVARL